MTEDEPIICTWLEDGKVRSARFIANDGEDMILRSGDTLILLPFREYMAGQRLAPEQYDD